MGVRRKINITTTDNLDGTHDIDWAVHNERTGLDEATGTVQVQSTASAQDSMATVTAAAQAALQNLQTVADLPYFFIVKHRALNFGLGTNPYEDFTAEVTVKGTWTESIETALTGTNNDLVFTAKLNGYSGVSIRYWDPGTETASETVEVIGEAITVTLRSVSSVLSTAAQVQAAIEGDAAANALISVANASGNDGTGVVTELDWIWLIGSETGYTVSSSIKDATPAEVDTTSDSYTGTESVASAMKVIKDAVFAAMRAKVTAASLLTHGADSITIRPFENRPGLTLDPPYTLSWTPADNVSDVDFAYTVTDNTVQIAADTLTFPDATEGHIIIEALKDAARSAISNSFAVSDMSNFTLAYVPANHHTGLLGGPYTIEGTITFLDPEYRVALDIKDDGVSIGTATNDYPAATLAKKVYGDARAEAATKVSADSAVSELGASADYQAQSVGEGINLGLDQYDGLLACPSPNGATGYFRVEKVNGRWWMVTPEGNYFFSRAIANTATSPGNDKKKFDQVWQVDADGGPAFVDKTAAANSATEGDWDLFPASEAVGDYVAFGFAETHPRVRRMAFNYSGGTIGVGGVVAWEYWNGSAWAALSDLNDATDSFTVGHHAADERIVSFTTPGDWAATALNGETARYYVRARVTTVYTTNPVYDRGYGLGDFFNDFKPFKYGAQDDTWAVAQKQRLREHGFNSTGYGPHGRMKSYPSGASGPVPGKPWIAHMDLRINFCNNAVLDNGNVLGENIKNVAQESGWNAGTMPDFWDPKFELYCKTRWLNIPVNGGVQQIPQSKHLIGYIIDEGDAVRVFNIDNSHTHPGWVGLCGPPTQSTGTWHSESLTHIDTKNYTKAEMMSFLEDRHGTIGALNTAWGTGGAYTTFGSNGGWGVGDGLEDEDGTLGVSWLGNDKVELGGANSTIQTDLNDFMVLTFQRLHRIVKETVRQDDPNHLIGSIYSFGASRPRQQETLTDPASGQPFIDFCLVGGRPRNPGESMTLRTLYERTYEAGIPLITASYFITSENDSLVVFAGGGSGQSLADQPSRARTLRSHWDRELEFQDTASGDAIFVGHQWWQLTDNLASEGRNYGVFTFRQNAYDGVENTTIGGTDKLGFPIIPEDEDPPIDGDFFTECVKANKHCDKRLISLYYGGDVF